MFFLTLFDFYFLLFINQGVGHDNARTNIGWIQLDFRFPALCLMWQMFVIESKWEFNREVSIGIERLFSLYEIHKTSVYFVELKITRATLVEEKCRPWKC